jgi:hypothetical protein
MFIQVFVQICDSRTFDIIVICLPYVQYLDLFILFVIRFLLSLKAHGLQNEAARNFGSVVHSSVILPIYNKGHVKSDH